MAVFWGGVNPTSGITEAQVDQKIQEAIEGIEGGTPMQTFAFTNTNTIVVNHNITTRTPVVHQCVLSDGTIITNPLNVEINNNAQFTVRLLTQETGTLYYN